MRRSTVSLVRSRSGTAGEANRVTSNSPGQHKKLGLFPAYPAKLYGFRLAAFCLAAASGHARDAYLWPPQPLSFCSFTRLLVRWVLDCFSHSMFAAGWSCERHLIVWRGNDVHRRLALA